MPIAVSGWQADRLQEPDRQRSRWHLRVLEVATLDDHAVAEERSIDDQVEWLDNETLAYSDGRNVYTVPADGSGERACWSGTRARPCGVSPAASDRWTSPEGHRSAAGDSADAGGEGAQAVAGLAGEAAGDGKGAAGGEGTAAGSIGARAGG